MAGFSLAKSGLETSLELGTEVATATCEDVKPSVFEQRTKGEFKSCAEASAAGECGRAGSMCRKTCGTCGFKGLRVSRIGPFCLLSGSLRRDRTSQRLLAVLPDECRPAGRRMYNLEAKVRADVTKNGDVELANQQNWVCLTGIVFRSLFPDAECTKLDDHLDNAVLALGGQPKHVHRPHTHTPHRHHRHVKIEKHVPGSALWNIPSSWTFPTHRHSAGSGGIAPMTQSPGWKHSHGPGPNLVARANFKRLGDKSPAGNAVDTRLSNTVDTLPQHRHTHQHSPQHRHVAQTRHPTFMTTSAPSHGRTPSPTQVPTMIPTPPTAAPTLVPKPPTSAPTLLPFLGTKRTPVIPPTRRAPISGNTPDRPTPVRVPKTPNRRRSKRREEAEEEEEELNGASFVFQTCATKIIVIKSVVCIRTDGSTARTCWWLCVHKRPTHPPIRPPTHPPPIDVPCRAGQPPPPNHQKRGMYSIAVEVGTRLPVGFV